MNNFNNTCRIGLLSLLNNLKCEDKSFYRLEILKTLHNLTCVQKKSNQEWAKYYLSMMEFNNKTKETYKKKNPIIKEIMDEFNDVLQNLVRVITSNKNRNIAKYIEKLIEEQENELETEDEYVTDEGDEDDEDDDESVVPKTKEDKEISKMMKERNAKPNNILTYFINDIDKSQKKEVINDVKDIITNLPENDDMFLRILKSEIPIEIKRELWNKVELKQMEKADKSDSEYGKFMEWFDAIINFPFSKTTNTSDVKDVSNFLSDAQNVLDEAVYGHKEAKNQVLRFLAQKIRNPKANGKVLGFQGPMGNGKTTLVEKGIAKILGRPFVSIPLGGAKDSTFLSGHQYTYIGATFGMIANVINKAKCINPVIYLDELDKISETQEGQEIVNLLIHLIDPSQNNHFRDNYFGNINIDLSQVMWIFSFNNYEKVNPILLDRINIVSMEGFLTPDKLHIAHNYLIPSILEEFSLNSPTYNITFSDNMITTLIEKYTYEAGVRTLKKFLQDIVSVINYNDLVNTPKSLKRKRVNINIEENDIKKYLPHLTPFEDKKIHKECSIGTINGMYATDSGLGGITPLESSWFPTTDYFPINITGNCGKIMKESVTVARDIAWKLTPIELQKKYLSDWEKYKQGIHIHASDASSSKEGPSAGTALTILIYSILNNKLIRNDVAITGEINLQGHVLAIGGLKSKLYGAKKAGVRLALYPKENENDMEIIRRDHPDLLDDGFDAKPVQTIDEALRYTIKEAQSQIIASTQHKKKSRKL